MENLEVELFRLFTDQIQSVMVLGPYDGHIGSTYAVTPPVTKKTFLNYHWNKDYCLKLIAFDSVKDKPDFIIKIISISRWGKMGICRVHIF